LIPVTARILYVYADGASRGNPGQSSVGVVIRDQAGNLKTLSERIGIATNNVAEYTALIRALEEIIKIPGETIHCHMDSQLVIRQVTGMYRIKNQRLYILAQRVKFLCAQMPKRVVHFHHIDRELNSSADALANAALDIGSRKMGSGVETAAIDD